LSTFSAVSITECAGTGKAKTVHLAQEIRLKPTAPQAKQLRHWMRCARQTHNRALHLVKTGKQKPTKLLKKLVVTARANDTGKIAKMKSCPAEIRSRAVLDLLDSYTSAWALHKHKVKSRVRSKKKWSRKREKKRQRRVRAMKAPFNIKYKSRRSTADSIGFESKSIAVKGSSTVDLFSSNKKIRLMGLALSEPIIAPLEKCVRITFKCGRWYLIVPYEASPAPLTKERKIVALDPGARAMFTYFCPNTKEWGDMACKAETRPVLTRVFKKRDALGKAMRGAQNSAKLRKAWYRQLARASNLTTDLHYKLIAWLVKSYDVIICPTFSTADMQARSTTKLDNGTRATFRFLSHYRFRQRLLYKAQQAGKIVLDVHEAETTMGCSSCGFKKLDVGRSEVYECDRCGIVRPRDMNSAVDIYLKRLYGDL
jgi:putative transposase